MDGVLGIEDGVDEFYGRSELEYDKHLVTVFTGTISGKTRVIR